VGIPTPEQPIFIAMKDFRLEDMELALSFLYTGYSSFRVGNIRHILGILQFLGVDHDCEVEPVVQEVVRKKRKELVRYKDLSEVASEDEGDELTVEVQDNPGSGTSNTKQRESRDEQKTDGDPASSSSVDVKKEKPSPVRSPSASSASSHRTTKRPSTSPKPCSSSKILIHERFLPGISVANCVEPIVLKNTSCVYIIRRPTATAKEACNFKF